MIFSPGASVARGIRPAAVLLFQDRVRALIGKKRLVHRLEVRCFRRYPSLIDQFLERLVHCLHAFGASGLNDRVDLSQFRLPDHVPYSRRTQQYLHCRASPFSIGRFEQLLGENGFNAIAEHGSYLIPPIGGEHVNYSIYGFDRGIRVQGAKPAKPFSAPGTRKQSQRGR